MKKLLLNNIKLVVFDVGKTIFDKECHEKINVRYFVLKELLNKKGILVGICTYRNEYEIKKICSFEFDFYILLNGSYIIFNNEVIFERKISNKFINEDHLTVNNQHNYFSSKKAFNNAKNNGFAANLRGKLKYPYLITLFNKDNIFADQCSKNYNVSYWKDTGAVVLQSRDCSKINGIKKITKFYQCSKDNVLYFGDGPNDMDVFKELKFCIMVKNGLPELKKHAFDKCEACINDGVLNYLNNLLKEF